MPCAGRFHASGHGIQPSHNLPLLPIRGRGLILHSELPLVHLWSSSTIPCCRYGHLLRAAMAASPLRSSATQIQQCTRTSPYSAMGRTHIPALEVSRAVWSNKLITVRIAVKRPLQPYQGYAAIFPHGELVVKERATLPAGMLLPQCEAPMQAQIPHRPTSCACMRAPLSTYHTGMSPITVILLKRFSPRWSSYFRADLMPTTSVTPLHSA